MKATQQVIKTNFFDSDWSKIMAMLLAMAAINMSLIGWVRSDFQLFSSRIDAYMTQSHEEMKAFHGKLCAIEARKKGE